LVEGDDTGAEYVTAGVAASDADPVAITKGSVAVLL
jgi:hypothetical protein